MLVALSGPDLLLDPGAVAGFPQDEALRLIERGYAVPFDEADAERAVKAEAPERRGKRR